MFLSHCLISMTGGRKGVDIAFMGIFTLGFIRHIPWAVDRGANGIEIDVREINGSWHHVPYVFKIYVESWS